MGNHYCFNLFPRNLALFSTFQKIAQQTDIVVEASKRLKQNKQALYYKAIMMCRRRTW
jgi:hypothetical protein